MSEWGPADWVVVIFFGFIAGSFLVGVILATVGAIKDWWNYQMKIGKRFEGHD